MGNLTLASIKMSNSPGSKTKQIEICPEMQAQGGHATP